MTIYNFSEEDIVEHNVFNELDSQGLALSLSRLTGERNAEYKQRLLDVFTHKANSSYTGLIYGITRELGLSLKKEFTITPTNPTLFPNAAIAFKDVRCCIYPDYYGSPETVTEIDRYTLALNSGYTLKELKDKIQAVRYDSSGTPTQLFTVTEEVGIDLSQRSATIFDQDSVLEEKRESMSSHGKTISLKHTGVFKDSEYIYSNKLKTKITDENATLKENEYRINYSTGTIECYEAPGDGSYISYFYRNDDFEIFSSPVIINNLQNAEFRKKMFYQILQDDGSYENGRPTFFGADIINELYSVYPTTYKD